MDTSKMGRMGLGQLATHFDRDADGKYEETHRGEVAYFDRNGDGVADLTVQGAEAMQDLEWDADFDGTFDHAVTSAQGGVHRWLNRREISKPASQIMKQDRIRRTMPCDINEPQYRFWEKILELEPQS